MSAAATGATSTTPRGAKSRILCGDRVGLGMWRAARHGTSFARVCAGVVRPPACSVGRFLGSDAAAPRSKKTASERRSRTRARADKTLPFPASAPARIHAWSCVRGVNFVGVAQLPGRFFAGARRGASTQLVSRNFTTNKTANEAKSWGVER